MALMYSTKLETECISEMEILMSSWSLTWMKETLRDIRYSAEIFEMIASK